MTRRFLPLLLAIALDAHAQAAWELSGFAVARAATKHESGPLEQQPLSAQLQLGLDWTPTPALLAHVHVVARNDPGSRRGSVGVPEAYVEANVHPGGDRLRLRAGLFFLPTSRENVDALWENAYAITSSALNSWFGEELRPVGIDATYAHRGAFAGATVFRGNDTLGAIPVSRGWSMKDHWTFAGEWVPVGPRYFTSVSAETDGRLGWAARGGWNGGSFSVQATHVDNRSDGREYGSLVNWGTRFDIVGAEYTRGDWTVAAERGWGPTFVISEPAGPRFTVDLDASYLLVSRGWLKSRATVRVDRFDDAIEGRHEHAVTLAYFHTLQPRLRLGTEVTAARGHRRAILELRYRFAL